MDKQHGEKKFERTSQEQLQCYIEYIKTHPGLLAGKNNHAQTRLMQEMWEEVANSLNALRGPTRTPAKWKESLANWKKQLRSPERSLKVEQMRTGGGPKPAELDDFNSQALEALGKITVEGISARQLGFEETVHSKITEALEVMLDKPCSPVVNTSSVCSSSYGVSPNSSPVEATPCRKYKRRSSQKLVEVVLEEIKKRKAFEERVLEQLRSNNDALVKVGEGMLALAETLKKP